jgi:hypothetical protein
MPFDPPDPDLETEREPFDPPDPDLETEREPPGHLLLAAVLAALCALCVGAAVLELLKG